MKGFAKSVLRHTPFRIVRGALKNRFEAISETMEALKRRGYRPKRIVDGGAHVGSFALDMRRHFPEAVIHLIEPQKACHPALLNLVADSGYILHPVALCAPAQAGTRLLLETAPDSVSTGAHVRPASQSMAHNTEDVIADTIDHLLEGHLVADDELLIKLDLQGFELEALRGATATLSRSAVVLTEVSFYAQAYEPPVADLVAFLRRANFDLYDIASIYARPRDNRPRQGDFVFVRRDSRLMKDTAWS